MELLTTLMPCMLHHPAFTGVVELPLIAFVLVMFFMCWLFNITVRKSVVCFHVYAYMYVLGAS